MTDTPTTTPCYWNPEHGAVHIGYANPDPAGRDQYVNELVRIAAATGYTATMIAIRDTHGGGVPLAEYAAYGDDATIAMLAEACAVIEGRARLLAILNHTFRPTGESPVALVILQNTAVLQQPQYRRVVEHIARYGAKAGVALAVVVPWPTLDELGGSRLLCSSLAWNVPV